jgi:hypothetical protein
LEYLDIDGITILNGPKAIEWDSVGLVQGGDKWRLTTITVSNIWVPRDTGSFLCLTFGYLEKQGVCCIVRFESMRYTELLVLNL